MMLTTRTSLTTHASSVVSLVTVRLVLSRSNVDRPCGWWRDKFNSVLLNKLDAASAIPTWIEVARYILVQDFNVPGQEGALETPKKIV